MQILEKMESPHEDEQWRELYETVEFTDDVHGGNALDKDKVIAARRLEMPGQGHSCPKIGDAVFQEDGRFRKGRQEGSTQLGWQDHHNKMGRH